MDVDLDSEPTSPEEYEPYRAAVRAYITEKAPHHGGNRGPDTPEQLLALVGFLREFRAAGYPLTTPYGIPDDRPVDPIEKQIVADELAAAGIPVFAGNPVGVWAISTFGSDEQKQRYLPHFLAMEQVWTQLFSEPDAGSDLASLRTTAVFDGDDYVINGSKIWSSYAHLAQYGLLLARTDSSVSKHNGISAFILDMSLPGITIAPLKQMTRDEEFNQVFFDNVRVKPAERIGEEGDGWPIARASVNAERLSVGGVSRRPAMSPLPPLIELAHRKHKDGTAPADDASVRQDIARLHARAHALKCLRFVLMTRQARDRMGPADASVAKVMSTDLRLEAFAFGASLFGSQGLYEDGVVTDRAGVHWWQDNFLFSRALIIGGGTNEIQRNLIAERGLGLPRDNSAAPAGGRGA
jgi:alkylation response protein AidB-like acyl-CoA dehydrogenase